MADGTLTVIIASLTIIAGILILIARFRVGCVDNEPRNPSAKAARGEIVVLSIVMIIGGLIAIIREL